MSHTIKMLPHMSLQYASSITKVKLNLSKILQHKFCINPSNSSLFRQNSCKILIDYYREDFYNLDFCYRSFLNVFLKQELQFVEFLQCSVHILITSTLYHISTENFNWYLITFCNNLLFQLFPVIKNVKSIFNPAFLGTLILEH